MGEIRIVSPGKTREYAYLVCKKIVSCPWAETTYTRYLIVTSVVYKHPLCTITKKAE